MSEYALDKAQTGYIIDGEDEPGGLLTLAFLKQNPNNSGIRGRLAGQVYSGEGTDTVVKEYTKPSHSHSEAVQRTEAAFTRGTQGWGLLTDEERAAWTLAAKKVMSKDPKRIRPVPIKGNNLYCALTAKFLQLNPAGTVPSMPPATKFLGDSVGCGVESEAGALVITGDRVNRAGVTTEVLLQRLDAAYRTPTKEYTHAAFHVFTVSSPRLTVPVALGAYSVAVQFVATASGEVSGFQVLGTTMVLEAVEGGLSDEAGAKKAA